GVRGGGVLLAHLCDRFLTEDEPARGLPGDRGAHLRDLLVRVSCRAQLPVHLDPLDGSLERAEGERRAARTGADDVAAEEVDDLLVGHRGYLVERVVLAVRALGEDRGCGLADGAALALEADLG